MTKTILKRLLHATLLLCGVCLLNFFLFELSPGDPTSRYFGPKTHLENLQSLRHNYGVDQPWHQQFLNWGRHVAHGDLGYSWSLHRPVAEVLGEALPATLQLTTAALLINLFLGAFVGVVMGVHHHRWWGRLLNSVSLALYSIPSFWLALTAIFLFSLHLHWLPASQMSSLFSEQMSFWLAFADRLRHLLLPAVVLGLGGAAGTARFLSGHIQEVLQQDYIRLAQAKGLTGIKIYLRHALPNALLPIVTLLGIYLPFLLGGAFIVEVIFAWPGMGRVAYEAIFSRDYPLIMMVNLVAAVMVIAGNLLADLLYPLLDPRMRVD